MNKNLIISVSVVTAMWFMAYIGCRFLGLQILFGTLIFSLALAVFTGGIIYKVLYWMRSPVPFRIPTTCGQQKSLPWIKSNSLDNPFTRTGVVLRMLMEVLFFRSLFRNTVMAVKNNSSGKKLVYSLELFLWFAALVFHFSLLVIVLRHLRFFTQPVPGWVGLLEALDGFLKFEFVSEGFSIGLPGVMLTGFLFLAALLYLLARRLFNSNVRYISLISDYFPLLLLIAIALSGLLMRYFYKVDILKVKQLTLGLVSFSPAQPDGIGAIFYIHMFLVSALLIYLPFSKLMHMGGVFLSPTRNLTADTRMNRHVNPWNPEVETHTYQEYEDEFRDVMINAGLPVDKGKS